MHGDTVVLVGVMGYLALTLFVGYAAGARVKDDEEFMVAGRSLPTWLCTFTIFATWFGAGTCLGAAGAAYRRGFLGIVADPLGAVLCLVLGGTFFFRLMRRFRFITIGDYLRERYGPRVEVAASLCMVPIYVGWVASQLVAFGYVLSLVTGLPTIPSICIGALVVLVYTAVGGMWAVAFTDFFQALVLVSGLLYLFPHVWTAAGGWPAIKAALPAKHLHCYPRGSWLSWLLFIQAWMILGVGDLSGQELMGRAMSARNEDVAQRSAYVAAALYMTVGLIPVLLGLAGAVLLPKVADPEYVLLVLGQRYLSPLGLAVFSGALISALMSSADSALLAQASLFVENIWRKYNETASPEAALRCCRTVVLIAGTLSLIAALWFQNVYELMINASAIGLVSIAAPFIAGLYWPRANELGALAAMATGLAVWVTCTVVSAWYCPTVETPNFLAGFIAGTVTLCFVSLATADLAPPTPLPYALQKQKGKR